MRITNNMLGDHFLYNYNNALSRVSQINDQISSGKSINKPSDDPVRAARALKFHTSSDMNDLFTQGVNDAISWMTTSDGALQTISTDMNNIQTKLTQAAQTNANVSFEALASDIDGYIKDIVQNANSQVGDRYVFAGQNDHVAPYSYDTATSKWVYNGTYDGQGAPANPTAGTITMKVSPGATDPVRDKVNVDGLQLFGAGTSGAAADPAKILNDLEAIKQAVLSKDPTVITAQITTLQTNHDFVLGALTTVGTRQATYENIKSRLALDYSTITSDLANNEDLDTSKAAIDFQIANNVYNAALAMGAKVLPQSLVDYLK